MRVLIAVTHLLGAGHLTRAAALARAFARAGHAATLVSGGRPAPLVATEGVDLVQLPPVRTAGADFAALLDARGRPANAELFKARTDRLLAALERVRPAVMMTELFPFGRRALAGEFLALLDRARAMRPRPLVLCSVRDILVAPVKPDRVAEAHARLDAFYDAVLVHGDPDLVPLDASWPVDAALGGLLHYTGYVDDGPCDGSPATSLDERGDEILVSGGSSAASLPLHYAALGAAALTPQRPWRVLVGGGVPEAAFAAIQGAAPANAAVERARPDFRALLARARLSVSQAGYNTAVDLLRARTPAVLVPFEAGRETEQRLRAERLAALGLACILPERDLSAERLARSVGEALARPRPPAPAVRLDGAQQTVALVETFASARGPAAVRRAPL